MTDDPHADRHDDNTGDSGSFLFRHITSPMGVLIGLACLVMAGVRLADQMPFWLNGVDATAQVSRVQNHSETHYRTRRSSVYQEVWFNYHTPNGLTYQGYDTADWNKYQSGNSIKIQWLSHKPDEARILNNNSSALGKISLWLAAFFFFWRVILWPLQAIGLITITHSK